MPISSGGFGQWLKYQRLLWQRARAEHRVYSRSVAALSTGAAVSILGAVSTYIAAKRMNAPGLSPLWLTAGGVGVLASFGLWWILSFVWFRIREPFDLDKELRADLEEASRTHSEESARVKEIYAETRSLEEKKRLDAIAEELAERKTQNALSSRQIELLEAQQQPLFRFVSESRSIGDETFDALEIWNDGAPIENYEVWQASYIEINRPERVNEKIVGRETRYLPAYYFIRRDYRGDVKVGLLVTLYAWRDPIGELPGINLTKEYERLEADVRPYGFELMISRRVFLEISYRDRTGRQRLAIYEIYSPSSFGRTVPRRRDNMQLSMRFWRDLNHITAKTLLEDWDNQSLILTNLGPGLNS